MVLMALLALGELGLRLGLGGLPLARLLVLRAFAALDLLLALLEGRHGPHGALALGPLWLLLLGVPAAAAALELLRDYLVQVGRVEGRLLSAPGVLRLEAAHHREPPVQPLGGEEAEEALAPQVHGGARPPVPPLLGVLLLVHVLPPLRPGPALFRLPVAVHEVAVELARVDLLEVLGLARRRRQGAAGLLSHLVDELG